MRKQAILTIIIDESGTLPDPKDRFIVVCGVGIRQVSEAKNLIKRILHSLRRRKIKTGEVKFYRAGQNTKRQFLTGIVSSGFEIFTLAIDKKGRKISDTPENFALIITELINEMHLWYKIDNFNLIIDRHFHRTTDREKFDKILRIKTNQTLKYQIKHLDSQQNLVVNIADMAAGAILWKYSGKDLQFYNIIKENILIEKIISWPELKRKSLQIKNHPNRRKRPSK